MSSLESVIQKNQLARDEFRKLRENVGPILCLVILKLILICFLQFTILKNSAILAKKTELRQENAQLLKQVEVARQQLIDLETQNGKKQILVPSQSVGAGSQKTAAVVATPSKANNTTTSSTGAPKEKKPKKEKPATSSVTAATASDEAPIDVGRLDLRVGRIVDISLHPDADSLYVEKIDCGEANPRNIISGLVKHVPIEQMRNRLVVVLCNLKPAKMRGIVSEGMVMCASTPDTVEVLRPPSDAVPGDLVSCDGFPRLPDAQLNPKKKIFETCAPDLHTNDALAACFKGVPWQVAGKGLVLADTLKAVAVK